uniref:Cytochrome P450, family 46, subfamily A, polypeptide 1, tandem duplicate 4 n=1 Tax=Sphaeramia orbicularis TaxID=375764 RepID=A0A672ZY12_9TELE
LMSPKYPKNKNIYKRLSNLFGQRLGVMILCKTILISRYLRGLMGTFNERAEKLMEKLTEEADKKTEELSMLQLFNGVTLDVIAKEWSTMSGTDSFLYGFNAGVKSVELLIILLIFQSENLSLSNIQLNPKNRPFINEVREACRLLRATGAQWIHDRKTAIKNGVDVPKDVLIQILKTAGQDEELMVDNFVTFFIAGHETAANQLAFCVMELGRHPEIMEKVKKEVDDVIGMKMDIRYEDLGQLTYLSQVLKETLRLYSTVPGTSRDILEDMVIDGIHIPGGCVALFSSYVTGRMEKFFKDPLTFDPDRFHPDAPKPYYCYYPFALGSRACLGKNFAQMETKVVMAKLLQRFNFTFIPRQTFDLLDTETLRPKSGVLCSIRHRKHSQ